MSSITRIYPIRTTRNSWKIPLACYHICNENTCKYKFVFINNGQEIILTKIDNPYYINNKCQQYNNIEKTSIKIADFNITEPIGDSGPLYNSDTIVIPDTTFNILITYPLTFSVDIIVRSSKLEGFTLKELLETIKNLYYFIYQEEERTSTPIVYNLKKICENCINTDILSSISDISEHVNGECSICYSEYKDKISKLNCNHIYHKECISPWALKSNTCPLCRQPIFLCSECKGNGFIYYDYLGTVIPIEHRGNFVNRNLTNGIFGIYGYDIEDLILQDMKYDRINKRLHIFIGS
jgi:hypothetical protein